MTDYLDRVESSKAFWFSRRVAVGATVVSALFLPMAIIVLSTRSIPKGLPLAIAATLSMAATLMLWMHNRYALYAWALVAAIVAGAGLLQGHGDNHHDAFYWLGKAGAVINGGIAIWLFRVGTLLTRG